MGDIARLTGVSDAGALFRARDKELGNWVCEQLNAHLIGGAKVIRGSVEG